MDEIITPQVLTTLPITTETYEGVTLNPDGTFVIGSGYGTIELSGENWITKDYTPFVGMCVNAYAQSPLAALLLMQDTVQVQEVL